MPISHYAADYRTIGDDEVERVVVKTDDQFAYGHTPSSSVAYSPLGAAVPPHCFTTSVSRAPAA